MATAIEIKRLPGTQVDRASKGWGPEQKPDEWQITIPLSDTRKRTWARAWEEVTGSFDNESVLRTAWWEYLADKKRIEAWVTEDNAEDFIRELDEALDRANALCAEYVAQQDQRREQQAEHAEDDKAQATRMQDKLDSL